MLPQNDSEDSANSSDSERRFLHFANHMVGNAVVAVENLVGERT